MRRHQLSRIKRANLPYIAAEVEAIFNEAPGKPIPPPVRKSRSNTKLELADAKIRRCSWCGSWCTTTQCRSCRTNGYPTIDDLGETA